MQAAPISLQQHGTAARRKDTKASRAEFGDHLQLDIAKAVFTLPLEESADRFADSLLDHRIGIDETDAELPRERTADRGFS